MKLHKLDFMVEMWFTLNERSDQMNSSSRVFMSHELIRIFSKRLWPFIRLKLRPEQPLINYYNYYVEYS